MGTCEAAPAAARRQGESDAGAEPFQTGGKLRILVVDDHPAVRAGLRELLGDEDDFRVLGAVEDANAALAFAEREEVDVAVVDYQLGRRDGLWVSRKLKRLPQPPRVVLYSAHCEGTLAAAAVAAEADALVGKGVVGAELCEVVRRVAHGRRLLPVVPPWLGEVMRERLSHEEQAIFGLLAAGIVPDEIAGTLGLSRAEVEARLWELVVTLQQLAGAGAAPSAWGPDRPLAGSGSVAR